MFTSEVIGNLGSDVEIKDVNGKKFAAFAVAHSDKWTDAEGKEHSTTTWIDCIMNNTEAGVLQFLKAGVKVFVRGNTTLRVFSSKKDRCMKAGATLNVREIELCGGSSDAVPRRLIIPDSGQIVDVTKYYWCQADTKGMKKEDVMQLVDERGNWFNMDYHGFVTPVPTETAENNEAQAAG